MPLAASAARDARIEVGRERLEAGVAWWLARAGGELLAEEQVVPGTRQGVTPQASRYGANVRSYLLLPCGPISVSRASPPANRITVGTERTP